MVMEQISQMDGRQRGQILKNYEGQPISKAEWEAQINREIDQCLNRKKHYQKFVGENPDLKVLMDYEQSKIDAMQKETRLVNYSKRGIKERVKAYEQAMSEQGMTGKELKEHVAQYRENLLNQRRAHFDKLKGENNAANIAKNKTQKTPKQGFFKKLFSALKGNKGKIGAAVAAAAAIGTTIAVVKGCENSTPALPVNVAPTDSTEQVIPEDNQAEVIPTTPEDTQTDTGKVDTDYKPLVEIDSDGNYTTKKGDSFFRIAKKHLQDLNKQNGVDKEPTQAEIKAEAEKLMRQNGYWYEENKEKDKDGKCRNSEPILYPDIKLLVEKAQIAQAA